MGSRKFLIVSISVLTALALVVLGASAVEPNVKAVNDSGASKIAPISAPDIQRKLFDPIYVFSSDVISTSWANLVSILAQAFPDGVTCTSIFACRDGYYNSYFEDSDGVLVTFNSTNSEIYWGSEIIKPPRVDFNMFQIRLTASSSVFPSVLTAPNNPVFVRSVVTPVIGFLSGFVSSLFSVGGQVITFVTSNWVVALPLVAFVLVICISVIRRIVKGV